MAHASYLRKIFQQDKFKATVFEVAKVINRYKKIEHIVATGVSGLPLGGALAFVTGLPLTVVRKGETTHSSFTVETNVDCAAPYVFVDDLISGGTTIKRVINSLDGFPALIVLYEETQRFGYESGYYRIKDERGRPTGPRIVTRAVKDKINIRLGLDEFD